MLRGDGQQDRVVGREIAPRRGDLHPRLKLYAGEARIFARLRDPRRRRCIARIERHPQSGTRRNGGECRAPGAGADDGNVLDAHGPASARLADGSGSA